MAYWKKNAPSCKFSYCLPSSNTYFICLWRGRKEIFRIKNSIFYVAACRIEIFTSPAEAEKRVSVEGAVKEYAISELYFHCIAPAFSLLSRITGDVWHGMFTIEIVNSDKINKRRNFFVFIEPLVYQYSRDVHVFHAKD